MSVQKFSQSNTPYITLATSLDHSTLFHPTLPYSCGGLKVVHTDHHLEVRVHSSIPKTPIINTSKLCLQLLGVLFNCFWPHLLITGRQWSDHPLFLALTQVDRYLAFYHMTTPPRTKYFLLLTIKPHKSLKQKCFLGQPNEMII